MAEPEHISSILARVFKELEKQYNGGCPPDRKLEASTFQACQFPIEGEKLNGKPTS